MKIVSDQHGLGTHLNAYKQDSILPDFIPLNPMGNNAMLDFPVARVLSS